MRGTLRAALSPVHIATVLSSNPFPHSSAVSHKLAAALVQELLSDGAVSGTFKAAGLVFHPSAYEKAQVDAARSFLANSRVLEYSMVAGWGVADPRAFLLQHCPDGIPLDTAYVSSFLVDEVSSFVSLSPRPRPWVPAQRQS